MGNPIDTGPGFCPHLKYDRTGRAYKCRDCGMPLVIHGVPMTLQQVKSFEEMRRGQAKKMERRRTGLILPASKKCGGGRRKRWSVAAPG